MGWTAPATYSVAEVVTAAKLNTHIRDNLDYLKGNAGTVAIAADIAPTGVAALRNDGSYQFTIERTTAPAHKYGFAISSAAGALVVDDLTRGATIWGMDALGNMGIGTQSPAGKLHVAGAISGALHWEYNGVDGTARTVIPDGAGDVLYKAMTMYVARASDGSTGGGNLAGAAMVPGGGNNAMLTVGADVLSLRINANGSVEVLRSAGTTLTFKVTLWIIWL